MWWWLVMTVPSLVGFGALQYLQVKLPRRVNFHDRLERLSTRLLNDSQDADEILREMRHLTKERSERLHLLEVQIDELSRREATVKLQLAALEKVQPEAVARFSELLDQGERRTTRRDYILMFAGAVLATVFALILKLVGVL